MGKLFFLGLLTLRECSKNDFGGFSHYGNAPKTIVEASDIMRMLQKRLWRLLTLRECPKNDFGTFSLKKYSSKIILRVSKIILIRKKSFCVK